MKLRKKNDELLDDSFDRAQAEEAKRQAMRDGAGDGALVGGRLPTREEVSMRDIMMNLKRRGVLV